MRSNRQLLFRKGHLCYGPRYDDNKIFLILDHLKQDYVIRLKSNRKLLYHNKWTKATEPAEPEERESKNGCFL